MDRSYNRDIGVGYPFIRQGKVAEPYRTTTLTAFHHNENVADLTTCQWDMEQYFKSTDDDAEAPSDGGYYPAGVPSDWTTQTGNAIEIEFQSPGKYKVSLQCMDDTGTVAYTVNDIVGVYYVRRELRQLSDVDRDIYLDTFKILQEVDTSTGKKTYGEHYHDLDYFVNIHLDTAGARSHDKIHDGVGVVTQHVSITQAIEQAMQEVNPSITVPFWDYTIDSYESKTKNNGLDYKIFESELWGPKWFGNTSGVHHHITDGRWSHQKISVRNTSVGLRCT